MTLRVERNVNQRFHVCSLIVDRDEDLRRTIDFFVSIAAIARGRHSRLVSRARPVATVIRVLERESDSGMG